MLTNIFGNFDFASFVMGIIFISVIACISSIGKENNKGK